MCGICGILNCNGGERVDESTIRRMCSVLKHRGPDDEGVYSGRNENGKSNVGLGIRRLAVIDLETGHQPIHNEDKTIWVVCNGEIYNFKELRKDLEDAGHRFYTNSDVEVIVHLYERHGVDCLEFLRGMFAFAVWDKRKERLFLGRDRLGQKPLCYTKFKNQLIFASEIKSILQVPEVPREVNLEAIHNYLTYQYVPSPLTAFKNIRKLPPAHYLLCDRGGISIERYWNLNMNSKLRISENEYCERIRELFEESVRLRLITDVPLGAFLSGGLDSSIIVGIMSKLMGSKVKTFSIGFREKKYDELDYAKIVAKHFSTDHHEYVVKPDAIELLPKLIWHYNEPFADSSAIPTYCVAKETRQEVTVALTGDGGDENFAGYPRYKAVGLAKYYDKLPECFRKNVIGNVAKLIPYSTEQKTFVRRLRRFVESMNRPAERRYARWMCMFDNSRKNELYTPFFKEVVKEIDSFDHMLNYFKAGLMNQTPAGEEGTCRDFLDSTLFVDIMTYLPGDLLVKMDIATMANSLEARSPFLDHKFMEFAASIPSGFKLRGSNSKYILKKAFSDVLPREILRRGKMGFGVPIGSWFRNELREYICEILLSEESIRRGYFRKDYLRLILDEHCNSRYDHSYRLWTLLNLELWHRMFIDRIPDGNSK